MPLTSIYRKNCISSGEKKGWFNWYFNVSSKGRYSATSKKEKTLLRSFKALSMISFALLIVSLNLSSLSMHFNMPSNLYSPNLRPTPNLKSQ